MFMKAPERFDRSEDELHEVAARLCGLTDFGTGYRDGLRVLLASMDVDPRFTPQGRQLAWDAVVMTMVARATAEENWKRYPEAVTRHSTILLFQNHLVGRLRIFNIGSE